MAGTRFAYVRNFELPDPLLPDTYIVLRIDGHSFHRQFSEEHELAKPNDVRALKLMDEAASSVMEMFTDITLAFGESDEFSFLFKKSTNVYNRRNAKILTTVVSQFTSSYVFNWAKHFPGVSLKYPPSFDGRIVLYPTEKVVRDYFSWRQADTHINNLYNTAFWALVQEGKQTTTQAHEALRGTNSAQKNQLLFERFGINYNDVPERMRKGSVIVREEARDLPLSVASFVDGCGGDKVVKEEDTLEVKDKGKGRKRASTRVTVLHCDLIRDEFWDERPYILSE
ncbi:tRNAHis guanylyltransferase [Thelephora ganbajun]|uniref:tRNAHis guanylyltransferase n=1 Tax=Thelephora ganbajun TaxID=370292 RepID=A0ACB6ZE81_THEGA|nr:tRNAHis guanylyltransferase [Thelephora ganbajun]